MKAILAAILLWAGVAQATPSPLGIHYPSLVAAIERQEGGNKTKYAYGVKSIKTKSRAHARQICLNTIRNTEKRYLAEKPKMNFWTYLGRRYCPPSDDPKGHRNWVANVPRIYFQNLKANPRGGA